MKTHYLADFVNFYNYTDLELLSTVLKESLKFIWSYRETEAKRG